MERGKAEVKGRITPSCGSALDNRGWKSITGREGGTVQQKAGVCGSAPSSCSLQMMSLCPPADRGSSRRVELHSGLLWCTSDPPLHHQPDVQEASPVTVSTPAHPHQHQNTNTGE